MGGLGSSFNAKVKSLGTGREVPVIDDSKKVEERLRIEQWMACKSKLDYLRHEVADRFRSRIKAVQVAHGDKSGLFRGQWKTSNPPPASIEFGPPPKVSKAERYNEEGKPVLYLSDSVFGVEREMCRRKGAGLTLFCQEYRLPPGVLKLANVSVQNVDGLINQTLFAAESIGVGDDWETADYTFSQVVATLVQEAGFDGMLVPGVRGLEDRRYHNVVIFEPRDIWKNWLDDHRQPYQIAQGDVGDPNSPPR